MSYQKILIGVDSSEPSIAAAKKGLELAHLLNAKTALLFVLDTAKTLGNVDAGLSHEDALVILKKEAQQTLDHLASYNGVGVEKLMPEGVPNEDIIKTAETWGADLIVVGTHGRKGLAHLLTGSVAEHIVRHSPIPVLVIPSK